MKILKKIRAFCEVRDWDTGELKKQICHFIWPEKGGCDNGLFWELVEDVHIEEYLSEPDAWTGHTDKKGIDIYQGDIVEREPRLIWGKVFYSPKEGRFLIQNKTMSHYLSKFNVYNMEVIGNVHENPELWNKEYEQKEPI